MQLNEKIWSNVENFKTIDDLFPQELANNVLEYLNSENISLKYGWQSNKMLSDFGHWNYDFGKTDPSNTLDISEKILDLNSPISEAWKFLKTTYFDEYDLLRCYLNCHTFGTEGYIHTDSHRPYDLTLVTYWNEDWNRQYGGETMLFYENKIIHAEFPKFNKGLLFAGATAHCARGLTRICPALRKTMMFKMALKNQDEKRNNLQKFLQENGAFNIHHGRANKNSSLAGHLLRVYDNLKRINAPDEVCLAGGCHSIFGTNHFKFSLLDIKKDIKKLESIIGKEASRLVFLFNKINRPLELENNVTVKNFNGLLQSNDGGLISVSQNEFLNLCLMEIANLHDQKSLRQNKYPNLCGLEEAKKIKNNKDYLPTLI